MTIAVKFCDCLNYVISCCNQLKKKKKKNTNEVRGKNDLIKMTVEQVAIVVFEVDV